MSMPYTIGMSPETTPQSILQQISQIQRLDRGTISVFRHGPAAAYYNHQCYENGRNISRYVPREQLPALQEAIEGYHRFQQLVDQYVELLVQKTRAERQAAVKKKTPPPTSSSPRSRKSSS